MGGGGGVPSFLFAYCYDIVFILFSIRYRALIEKVASDQEVHVLYVDFGNVSIVIMYRVTLLKVLV